MGECCGIHPVHGRQRSLLRWVLGLNAAMFVIELGAGMVGHSSALLADAADMLGDAIAYGFTLYVIGRGPAWQTRAALRKGTIMLGFAAGILVEMGTKLVGGVVPSAGVMSSVGLLALAVNTTVLVLLWRHHGDDLNMRSAWLCSRNDVAANLGVLVAALGVGATGSAWPDIVVGLSIAGLVLTSARSVLRAALRPGAFTPPG